MCIRDSAETVRAVVDATQPEQIVVIDALAAADPARICASIQLTDTGIVPGSGVGNSRAAFNRETLGAPVVAIGVPTVVDAQTLLPEGQTCAPGMIVTPRDIDARVRETAQVIGYALDVEMSIRDRAGCGSRRGRCSARAHGAASVSYTHLDVYKRQANKKVHQHERTEKTGF